MRDLRPTKSSLVMILLALSFFVVVAKAQNGTPNVPQRPDAAQAASSPKTTAEPRTTDSAIRKTATTPETSTDSVVVALRDRISAAAPDQERTQLQLQLVEHFVARGLKQEAIVELQSMSGEDRFNPQGFYNIANAQARLGDAEGAIKSYRKAIEQRKGRYSRASNNLGVVLMRVGHWDESYEALMLALRQESFRYAEASYNLGRLYAARGESDLAIREWRRAVTVDPEHSAAAKALANAGSAEAINVAAYPSRSLSSNAGGVAASRSSQPGLGAEKRDVESARSASDKPAALRPILSPKGPFTVDPETYVFLQRGRAARDRGLNDAAVENYRRVIARMGGYFPPANLELSYVLIALKRNSEAAAVLLPVTIRDGQKFPISYYHLARLHEAEGDLKLAEDYYRRAAESYGESNSQFLLDLTRVREKQGNVSGALASLEQYVSFLQRQGQKPEWSDQRLAELRLKVAASPTQPKQ